MHFLINMEYEIIAIFVSFTICEKLNKKEVYLNII